MKLFGSFKLCCVSKKNTEISRTTLETQQMDIYALIVGDSEVGKSSIVDAMNSKTFDPFYRKSHVFDFQKFQITDKDSKAFFNFRVWELNVNYQMAAPFNKVQVIYYVFSFDNRESFSTIKRIKKQSLYSTSLEKTKTNKPIEFLIANKSDIEDKQVHPKKSQDYAAKNNMIYIELSCSNSEDIQSLKERTINIFRSSSEIQERGSEYTSRVRMSIV